MTNRTNRIIGWVMIIAGMLYIGNFTFGIIEFIPDNLPLIGNLDEGVAGALVWQGIERVRKNG